MKLVLGVFMLQLTLAYGIGWIIVVRHKLLGKGRRRR